MFLILVSVAGVFRRYLSQPHVRVGAARTCRCSVVVGAIASDGHDAVTTVNPEKSFSLLISESNSLIHVFISNSILTAANEAHSGAATEYYYS